MLYPENKGIEFLANHLDDDLAETSSHWEKYHKDFNVGENLDTSGIQGFGGNSKPYSGIRKWIHKGFQTKYRKIGAKYTEFETFDSIAYHMTQAQDRAYDLDVLRQSITLAFLTDFLKKKDISLTDKTVAVIGDGFASLSLLLLLTGFARKVILVNLTKTLFVDLFYFKKYTNKDAAFSFALVTEQDHPSSMIQYDLIGLQASNSHLLHSFPVDLFINIASM